MIDAYGLDAAGSRWRHAAAPVAAEVLHLADSLRRAMTGLPLL
jgi:hypothetical protein